MNTIRQYDYIITGGGCAGLSLACQLAQSPILQHKKILLLDQSPKTHNDRTWCFWEEQAGPFEAIVSHHWPHLWVHQGKYAASMPIAPLRYKMIRGLDFYRHAEEQIAQCSNIERLYANVDAIYTRDHQAVVEADNQTFQADWCFNSILFEQPDTSRNNYLDQHFRGWFIKTESDVFDPAEATLMDFRTPQYGETRFLYVLPYTPREALVEVAIFSNQHLTIKAYDQIIGDYLQTYWPHIGAYSIEQTEMGVIPMTDYPFKRFEGRVIHLGTAGGDTKASTGYTFLRIQRQVQSLVNILEAGQDPRKCKSLWQRRYELYDSLLLRVLVKAYYPGDKLFARLFQRNPVQRVLRFLNEDTSFFDDLRLMSTTPIKFFLRALLEKLKIPFTN